MRIVVAIGGNALLTRDERADAEIQRRHVRAAAVQLAEVARDHTVVVCHGNGPQVGLLARESEDDESLTEPFPLDVLGAQTQGMIGYWLAQELSAAGVVAPVAALVTQTEVSGEDGAFANPTKFIGPVLSSDEVPAVGDARGWTLRSDGTGWRRVVPSPDPLRIVELPVISRLVDAGVLVVCGGGGGVPVCRDERATDEATATGARLTGVEAVVDKDLTAALIASQLGADRLVILTDVDAVRVDFGTTRERALERVTAAELAALSFPAGSMGPKVTGCLRFLGATVGTRAAIGALIDARAVVDGLAGTQITREAEEPPRHGRP